MALKIERIETFGVDMPLAGSFTSGGLTLSTTQCIAVRITASDGAVGISSIDPSSKAKSPNTARELEQSIREKVTPALIGQDLLNLRRLTSQVRAVTPEQPGTAAAIETACLDLECQRLGIPLHQYLGGAVDDHVRFNGWIGELPPDEAAAEAKRWLDAGFKSAKIKVGTGVEQDSARVAAVRETVGGAMQLRMDANQQYDVAGALALCGEVRQFDMQLFEQPTPKDDLEALARIRREGGLPVMADESISDHESLINVIKADCADFVKFGIKQAGGLLRAQQMIATAEAAGLPVVLGHGFGLDPSTMAEIMLGSTSSNVVPGLECVGPLKVVDTVATTRLDLSRGSIDLPTAPGLGITLDEQKLERYRSSADA